MRQRLTAGRSAMATAVRMFEVFFEGDRQSFKGGSGLMQAAVNQVHGWRYRHDRKRDVPESSRGADTAIQVRSGPIFPAARCRGRSLASQPSREYRCSQACLGCFPIRCGTAVVRLPSEASVMAL